MAFSLLLSATSDPSHNSKQTTSLLSSFDSEDGSVPKMTSAVLGPSVNATVEDAPSPVLANCVIIGSTALQHWSGEPVTWTVQRSFV